MEHDELLRSLIQAVREQRLVVFCGAGVSMLAPSCSPSWWEIYVAAAQALADRLLDGFPHLAPELRMDELLAPLTTQQLADLVFSRFAGQTFSELLKVVDIADPNENHRALATLADLGGLRASITTNFDTLIERAAAVRGVRFAVAAPGIPASSAAGAQALLVKLHGSTVEPSSMIETTSQKAREISPTLRAAWLPVLAGADLLVVGYSGADLNFGAAREFFTDALAAGARIWWLCRPGSSPTLSSAVGARATLVEGQLPDLLRELVTALGETDYATPVTGRDAQAALTGAMQAWSREFHIGAWSAASFYLALCQHAKGAGTAGPLLASLLQVAQEQLPRFEPGSTLELQDLGAAGFFSGAGMHQLQHLKTAEAMALLRACINVYEATNHYLGSAEKNLSHDERRMNLSSSWNNYAHACLISGQTGTALQAFRKALEHAYLGGKVDSFLISLGNLLHYGFELREVRRCLRIAQSAVALADRVGAVQSSIELRLLLALYACDRSEIWLATRWLEEALHRSVAIGNSHLRSLATIQLGECLIRSGRIAAGLEMIAEIVADHPKTAFLSRAVEETRRYLETLGIEQPVPFFIRLEPAQLPELVAKIETERTAARENHALPWKGAHCAMSDSSHLGRGDGPAMARIGYLEFDSDANGAAEVGLDLAERLAAAELTLDAGWVAQNVLARPGLPAAGKARAEAVLAYCAAALGQPGEAQRHIENARSSCDAAGMQIPPALAEVGLWVAIQLENVAAAIPWAKHLADGLTTQPQCASDLVTLVAQIESWGPAMNTVTAVLRTGLSRLGLNVPPSTSSDPALRYRRFRGVTASTGPGNPQAHALMIRAQQALAEGETNRALSVLDELDELAELGELSEHQTGAAVALQTQAAAATRSAEQIAAFTLGQRYRLLGSLAFGALARLETTRTWIDVLAGRYQEAAERLRRHGWVGDLSDDPIPRASLQAWEARRPWLTGGSVFDNERTHGALQAARFLGLSEATLADPEPAREASNPGADLVAECMSPLYEVFQSSDNAREVDQALREAVARLRQARCLRRDLLARWRGDRANWALRSKRYEEAIRGYLRAERSFRALGLRADRLNAMAGRARALSRSGDHRAAVRVFQQAISEASAGAMHANLLLGLGAAHLLEASRRDKGGDSALTEAAIAACQQAIDVAPLDSPERANARLTLARALGENGQQAAAMEALDFAIAELAHLGHSSAKALQEHRDQFIAGHWQSLGLM